MSIPPVDDDALRIVNTVLNFLSVFIVKALWDMRASIDAFKLEVEKRFVTKEEIKEITRHGGKHGKDYED